MDLIVELVLVAEEGVGHSSDCYGAMGIKGVDPCVVDFADITSCAKSFCLFVSVCTLEGDNRRNGEVRSSLKKSFVERVQVIHLLEGEGVKGFGRIENYFHSKRSW